MGEQCVRRRSTIDFAGALVQQIETGDIVLLLAIALLVSAGACFLCVVTRAAAAGSWADKYVRFGWQIGAVLGLEQAYEFTRGRISPTTPDVALLHSYRVLDLEWSHGFFVEQRLERFFLQFGPVMNAIDAFYIIGHLVGTIGILVWLYTRHRESYPVVRNLMFVTTAIALVAFYVYPTAPPRMLSNYGFVDPLQLHHLVAAGGDQPGSFTYNPYAAMPSLHVSYSLIVACGIWISERRTWARVLAVLYPVAMAATVIISGNHWILDVVGAVFTVGAAALAVVGCSWFVGWIGTFLPLKWTEREGSAP